MRGGENLQINIFANVDNVAQKLMLFMVLQLTSLHDFNF